MIFGSKLLSSFLMSAIYSFLNIYATERQAVVTLKIYNAGLDRHCATHFLTLLHPSLGFNSYSTLGTTGLYQLNNRCVKRRQVFLCFSAEPW